MICRHGPNDPSCSHGRPSYYDNYTAPVYTPDADKYQIEKFERVGKHLVLKVLYPNCIKCAYEGNKVMVFLNITEMQAMQWRKMDPHFRKGPFNNAKEAPSPAARFPASDEGWLDAVEYAKRKV